MTVPRRSERKGQNTEIEIKVEDPSHYTPDASLESSWQAVQFVCNLPVIKGTVSVDSKDQDVRFLVDSGELAATVLLCTDWAAVGRKLAFPNRHNFAS